MTKWIIAILIAAVCWVGACNKTVPVPRSRRQARKTTPETVRDQPPAADVVAEETAEAPGEVSATEADPEDEEVLEFRMIEVAEVQPPADEAVAEEVAEDIAEAPADPVDADEEEVLQFEMIEVADVQPPADEAVDEVAEEVTEPADQVAEAPVPPVLLFTMTTLDGRQKDLADYQGKVLLIVNTASQCGFTPQYAGLQQLHERFAQQGLVVMGFPANNFGGQEPGSDPQIAQFCKANFGVTFDMFSKISVAGADRHALYNVLTAAPAAPAGAAPIRWNFEKFLIARDGQIIGHYPSQVDPSALAGTIQTELAK